MANRLARATSPYLIQHADNPVDWFPWGEEAFAKAEREQKPILLSIGYATCHWCHVMAHESFEDAEIAAFLNAHFVPIKLDREERPDVDRVYMAYVQSVTGHGGWPLNVWLTPDLKPFFGGTYFPPRDAHGRRGFLELLGAIASAWRDRRDQLVHEANRVLATLAHHTRNAAAPVPAEPAPATSAPDFAEAAGAAFENCFEHLRSSFDEAAGGFGGAPKFPRASNLTFLFRAACIQGLDTESGAEALRLIRGTLSAMAKGGIHDAAGGGFHRYSVDSEWRVPHFEKMLYDQAQIAANYLEAFQATGEEVYAHLVRDILAYTERDLLLTGGAFASAEDADSLRKTGDAQAVEGAFYVWTAGEIREVLEGEAGSRDDAKERRGGDHLVLEMFLHHYGIEEGGNVPEGLDPHGELSGRNVLHQRSGILDTAQKFGVTPEEASGWLEACLAKLRVAREKRPRPLRDDKIVAAWNGLMISTLARASVQLDEPKFAAMAERAAGFLQAEMHDEATGVLYRSHRGVRGEAPGFAEDYAAVVQGLLDLYEATGRSRWLLWAIRLQEKMDALFWDASGGGYFATQAGEARLVLRLKDDYDGGEPTANSIAAMNLLRLGWMIPSETTWTGKGLGTIRALEPQWSEHPHALPQLLCAIEYAMGSPRTVVLVGEQWSDSMREMRQVLFAKAGPRLVVHTVSGTEDDAALVERVGALRGYRAKPGLVQAFVCERETCLPAVETAEELRRVIAHG